MTDNASVEALEEFLPRFHWASVAVIDALGATLVKWKGDGFLAWMEAPLHQDLPKAAASVLSAAHQLSMFVNSTQLGVKGKNTARFLIRHGVAYEDDALVIRIKHSQHNESLDLVGRAVVLAFRIASVPSGRFAIATQRTLVKQAKRCDRNWGLTPKSFTPQEIQKYFKGEKWGTRDIGVVHEWGPLGRRLPARMGGRGPRSEYRQEFIVRLMTNMAKGPLWVREVSDQYLDVAKLLDRAVREVAAKIGPDPLALL
jgi:hypothetical protein